MRTKFTIATVAALSLASAALAHTGAKGIVRERMVAMSAMADAIKTIAPMMSGASEYEAAAVRDAAEAIGRHAGASMTRLFPADNENMASYVKASIWQDWATFAELAERLHTYSEGLALAAENGPAAPKQGMADAASMMGGGGMMGAGSMMGTGMALEATLGREELADMPANEVFSLVSNTCSTCHTRFRKEAK
ncbi:MAG: cytochrome c [Marinovum algicola]|jgi:cytochrome c556|uniref:Cytochrome c556 n=1 Tax=Marinovum algicola TaxID=42444 RepID=A0A975WB65_9RHOB|nr:MULTISPECIES: cytochrome c [Marinovum]MDD9743988.1 cytochrome c [Marinovum sp. PR37]SEJ71087.1 Cytochrome c556 [Marinovum algicola]SLN55360.1 Cytochrome C' [Marinovum algicola]